MNTVVRIRTPYSPPGKLTVTYIESTFSDTQSFEGLTNVIKKDCSDQYLKVLESIKTLLVKRRFSYFYHLTDTAPL